MSSKGWTFKQAFDFVYSKRHIIDPNQGTFLSSNTPHTFTKIQGFLGQLANYEKQLASIGTNTQK
jgi:hypothetical protein